MGSDNVAKGFAKFPVDMYSMKISMTAKVLYSYLWNGAGIKKNDKTYENTASMDNLAKGIGASHGAIHKAIRELSEANLIEVRPGQSHRPSTYIILDFDGSFQSYNDRIQSHSDRIQSHSDYVQSHSDRIQSHSDRTNTNIRKDYLKDLGKECGKSARARTHTHEREEDYDIPEWLIGYGDDLEDNRQPAYDSDLFRHRKAGGGRR